MKNFDGPIWFLKDMSVGPTAFRKEYPLLLLDLAYPKSESLQIDLLSPRWSYKHSGERKNNISAIYSLIVQKIFMQFYHIEWSKVKETEILIRLRYSLFTMAATKF